MSENSYEPLRVVASATSASEPPKDWFDRAAEFFVAFVPVVFRFVEWGLVLGALWFVSARVSSRLIHYGVLVLLGLWMCYIMASFHTWAMSLVAPKKRSGMLGFLAFSVAMLLGWGAMKAAVELSAGFTAANMSAQERRLFYMSKEERASLRRSVEQSNAKPMHKAP